MGEAMEEQQAVTVTTTVRVAQKPKRPSSLLVGNGSNSLSSLNIPIETPTNVMNQLDFNALMDGRTGLTPTNILTPIMVNMTTSSSSSSSGLLQTPDGEPAGRGQPVGGQEEGLAGADPAAAGGEEPAGVHLGGAQVCVQQGLLRERP